MFVVILLTTFLIILLVDFERSLFSSAINLDGLNDAFLLYPQQGHL
jgi:hypothetical protein